jgi:hypothetical protein
MGKHLIHEVWRFKGNQVFATIYGLAFLLGRIIASFLIIVI